MLKFIIATILFLISGTTNPVSAQRSNVNATTGAVRVTATKYIKDGIRQRTKVFSRGTLAIDKNNKIIVITSGHSIDSSEVTSHITKVTVEVNGYEVSGTSWESRLGSGQDIGYIRFKEDIQEMLRSMALPIATPSSNVRGTANLFYLNNKGLPENIICTNIINRKNMVLHAKGDRVHPATRVHMTAKCNRRMDENSLSGSSLLNANGEIIAIFFADIQDQQEMNSAFSPV